MKSFNGNGTKVEAVGERNGPAPGMRNKLVRLLILFIVEMRRKEERKFGPDSAI